MSTQEESAPKGGCLFRAVALAFSLPLHDVHRFDEKVIEFNERKPEAFWGVPSENSLPIEERVNTGQYNIAVMSCRRISLIFTSNI